MKLALMEMLPPAAQAYVRSAGVAGALLFGELCVAGGSVPLRGELISPPEDDTCRALHMAPINELCLDDPDEQPGPLIQPSQVAVASLSALISQRVLTSTGTTGWYSLRGGIPRTRFPKRTILNFRLVDIDNLEHAVGVLRRFNFRQASLVVKGIKNYPMDGFPGHRHNVGPRLVEITFVDSRRDLKRKVPDDFCPLFSDTLEPPEETLVYEWTNSNLGSNFLAGCHNLHCVDLTPLAPISEVGRGFLSSCLSLTLMDLAPLCNVTRIKSGFMQGCTSITQIDLAPLARATEVGSHFFAGCEKLQSVDLRPLSQLARLGQHFFAFCTSLGYIHFGDMSRIDEIPVAFMMHCTSLKTVDLGAFTRVKEVGASFLFESGIEHVDLAPFASVEAVDEGFLGWCTHLKSVDVTVLFNGHTKVTQKCFLGQVPLDRIVGARFEPCDNVC